MLHYLHVLQTSSATGCIKLQQGCTALGGCKHFYNVINCGLLLLTQLQTKWQSPLPGSIGTAALLRAFKAELNSAVEDGEEGEGRSHAGSPPAILGAQGIVIPHAERPILGSLSSANHHLKANCSNEEELYLTRNGWGKHPWVFSFTNSWIPSTFFNNSPLEARSIFVNTICTDTEREDWDRKRRLFCCYPGTSCKAGWKLWVLCNWKKWYNTVHQNTSIACISCGLFHIPWSKHWKKMFI